MKGSKIVRRALTFAWKKKAHEKNPHCHWCGVLTELTVGQRDCRTPTTATTDHVKCRPECETQEEWDAETNLVLACHACNTRRAESWTKANPTALRKPSSSTERAVFVPARLHRKSVDPMELDAFRCHFFIETSVGVDMPIGYITKSGRRIWYGQPEPALPKLPLTKTGEVQNALAPKYSDNRYYSYDRGW